MEEAQQSQSRGLWSLQKWIEQEWRANIEKIMEKIQRGGGLLCYQENGRRMLRGFNQLL